MGFVGAVHAQPGLDGTSRGVAGMWSWAGLGWAGLILLLKLGHHLEIILGSLWNLSDLSWLCTCVCIVPDLCCVRAH